MNRASRVVIILVIIAATGVFSCSDSEHRIPFGYARAVINLNLPPETPEAQAGLIERMRRFLVPDAVAQSAPASFSNITVRVTGPDIALIEKSFAPYSTISLSVPAGALRIFEVTAYVAPGDPSAAASFRGTSSANCPAGETVSVPVVMGLNETKIVIPDPFDNIFYSIRRLIQINDMTGSGWTDIQGSDIGFAGTFYPLDVDFDSRGRIYIANNATSGSDVVIRINNMSATEHDTLGTGSGSGIVSVAVDRARNQVYYATSSGTLKRCNLDGTADAAISKTGSENVNLIRGLDMASDGTLYIAGTNGSGLPRIFRYDTASTQVTASYGTYLGNPNYLDVKSRGPNVYVANPGGASGYVIIQLTADLQFIAGYGSIVSSLNTNPGMFYSPQRFVGIRNDTLIVTDERPPNEDIDKLVSFNDITGAGWTTYGTTGKGVGQFQFFYGC